MRPEYSEDGVDLTLIRWMLSLTPGERLEVLQGSVDSLVILREKFDTSLPGTPEGSEAAQR